MKSKRVHLPLLFTGLLAFSTVGGNAGAEAPGTFAIEVAAAEGQDRDHANLQKMREIDRVLRETEIPAVELRDATLHDAFSFLSQKTGVRIVNALFPIKPADSPKVTLALRNIAAAEVLRYLLQLTLTQHEITPGAVLIVSTTTGCGTMEVGEYHVPFETMIRLLEKAEFSLDGKTDGKFLESPASLKECFEKLGLTFPLGSSVSYQPRTERLIIQTSGDALELLDVILSESRTDPKESWPTLEERHREKQYRRVLKARHQLSQVRLISVDAGEAAMQEVINGISEKLHRRVLFIQPDGTALQSPLPGLPAPVTPASSGPRLSLAMKDVTVLELLQELARQTGTKLIIGTRAIVLLAPSPSP